MARSDAGLLTRAERTDYAETSLHADVLAFLRELRRRTSLVRLGSMGRSPEGREMPVAVLSGQGAFTPASARRLGLPVVLVCCNIHAGEVEGKEAMLALLRDFTLGGLEPGLLEQLTLVVVPNLNPDGNDRISTENRKLDLAALEGQIGPSGGAGTRNTGEGWNLNRDYMKQEATESNHLSRLFGRWWPHLVVDCHTTDGSIHAYDLTFDTAHTPTSGHPTPIQYVRTRMLPAVAQAVLDGHGKRGFFYGNYRDQDDPASGWETYPGLPRFGSQYRGLTGRLDILLETYSYLDFRARAETIRAYLLEILKYVAAHGSEIVPLLNQTEQETIARGRAPSPDDLVGINYGAARRAADGSLVFDWPVHHLEEVEILAYDRPSIRARRIPGRRVERYETPHLARFIPTVSVPRPFAYVVRSREIGSKLLQHNIRVEELVKAMELDAEAYVVTAFEKTRSPDICTGVERFETVLTVRKEHRRVSFRSGDLVVFTGQRLGNLIVYLLEPESDDGLARWEFFDRRIQPGEPFPVYRVAAPTKLPIRQYRARQEWG